MYTEDTEPKMNNPLALSSSGFFVPGFPKLMRFQEHHDRILKKMIPKLKQHLVRKPVNTLKWDRLLTPVSAVKVNQCLH